MSLPPPMPRAPRTRARIEAPDRNIAITKDGARTNVMPAVLTTYACLLPSELGFELAGAMFHPYRFALVIVLPWAIMQFQARPTKLSPVDYIAGFAALWHFIAMLVTTEVEQAFITGFGQGADFALAYIVGRASIRDAADLRRYVGLVAPGFLIAGLLVFAESILQRPFVRPAFASLVGGPSPSLTNEFRFGLLRGTGTFPHPILGGTFLAIALPLFWYSASSSLTRWAGVAGSLMFLFTLSSGAYLAFLVVAVLMVMLLAQRLLHVPILRLGALFFTLGWTFLSVATENGAVSYLGRFLLDSRSVYWRKLIWTYAGEEAVNHPLFGIGTRDWTRPSFMVTDSIDAQWLLIAMRFGFPAAIAFALTFLLTAYLVTGRSAGLSRAETNARYAVAFALIAVFIAGITVALWGGLAYFSILLAGIGVSLTQSAPAISRPSVTQSRTARRPAFSRPRVVT